MSTLPPLLLAFWAKLGHETWPTKYHPVLYHLFDVGQVAHALWRQVCRGRLRRWVAERLGVPEDAAGRWLAFWAGAHDIGKLAACFQGQGKTEALEVRLKAEGYDFPGMPKEHGILSTCILVRELAAVDGGWPVLSPRVAQDVAVTVGGHHGVFPTDWDGIRSPLGNERWTVIRRQMLRQLADRFGVTNLPAPQPVVGDQSLWMVVAGLTSVADWIGSNQTFFDSAGHPALVGSDCEIDDYFAHASQQAETALAKLGWLGRSEAVEAPTFAELFGFRERPLQAELVRLADELPGGPGLVIVEAPMGEGKTEAAWYAALRWDRTGGQGTYVALPTMATSNQMFDRVAGYLGTDANRVGGKSNLMLQHGKAALNDKFQDLRYAAQLYDAGRVPSAVVAEGWFATNKKHGLLAPYGVGTIDQALLAVLQTKHVFVRLFGLAGKCVVLDEVHAYDTYMTTLMERLLCWLGALGCPVVLLSATLPREKRLKLLRAYAGAGAPEPEEVRYPRITRVSAGAGTLVRPLEADPKRARTLQLDWLSESDLPDRLSEALVDGGCAAVIRNTVGLAQQTYLELCDKLTSCGIAVELFHARFPFGRRKEIEDAVLRRFGKDGDPNGRTRRVLVATQVVEQSLDLDFDLMVTDVAPVDLVLQRAGRLHRHERAERPTGVREARLVLLTPELKDGLPDFGVNGFVYSPHVLFRSLLALRGHDQAGRDRLAIPGDIDPLVQEVYGSEHPPDTLSPAEKAYWERTLARHRADQERQESEADTRQIRKPKFRGLLARVIQEPREEDDTGIHPAHQALTRLTRPTAMLICLETSADGSYRLPHDGSPVPSLEIRRLSQGGVADVGRLLLAEVSVAHWGFVKHLQDQPRVPRAWAEVGMLCRHHLVVLQGGKAEIGGYQLTLDNHLGLSITRPEAEGEDE